MKVINVICWFLMIQSSMNLDNISFYHDNKRGIEINCNFPAGISLVGL